MINWINGHAPADMFKCLVCHDGLFSLESSYYGTEELFFMEHEFGGAPFAPQQHSRTSTTSGSYDRFSPHHAVSEWKTPTLVIHGSKDYRIVETEGIATFQALQRQGVPSELLVFPTEHHFCLKPEHSLVWHGAVFKWIEKWTEV